ncbi:MAG: ParB/RepB/Spo0J family partition protein [Roseovarius sp.]
MTDPRPRRGLGRGLSALMADVTSPAQQGPGAAPPAPDRSLPIERVVPNPNQPRRHFDADALEDLAASIREKGIIQPLIVRPSPRDPQLYEIVAGERRWRAAQMARLHEVPVLVRDFDDTEVLEVAIIENVQRADLNPLEEATGYQQLMEKFGHTQDMLARALGKSRSHIANTVRLLSLPAEVQEHLRSGRLTSGHARALITSDDPVGLARQVIARGLSVRDTERLVKAAERNIFADPDTDAGAAPSRPSGRKDADTRALEADLSAGLGMKVSIEHRAGKESGRVVISYDTLEQLDELCRILSLKNSAGSI